MKHKKPNLHVSVYLDYEGDVLIEESKTFKKLKKFEKMKLEKGLTSYVNKRLKTNINQKKLDKLSRHGDVKVCMSEILIQHNLLSRREWGRFHKEINVIVDKYYPLMRKGLDNWFKKGKMLRNI